jgi:hypothetical protein
MISTRDHLCHSLHALREITVAAAASMGDAGPSADVLTSIRGAALEAAHLLREQPDRTARVLIELEHGLIRAETAFAEEAQATNRMRIITLVGSIRADIAALREERKPAAVR